MLAQLLGKPDQEGLLANHLNPTAPQVLSIQLIEVYLISAHCLDQESLELDYGLSLISFALEGDFARSVLDTCHFERFSYGWPVLLQGASHAILVESHSIC